MTIFSGSNALLLQWHALKTFSEGTVFFTQFSWSGQTDIHSIVIKRSQFPVPDVAEIRYMADQSPS